MRLFPCSKIEQIIVKENSFPDILASTPEGRLEEILTILDSRDVFVTNEEKAARTYLATQGAAVANLLNANIKARDNKPTGSPDAKEILVLPVQSPIVYPTRVQLTLNDPANPDYTYHYTDYWLPKEVTAAVASLQDGALSSTEKSLIFNNIALTGLNPEQLKDLLLTPETSAEFNSAANQIAALAGDSDEYLELLQHMLYNDNYDASAVDLSLVDFSKLDPLTLNKLLDNPSLTSEQFGIISDKLLADGNAKGLAKLLANPSITGSNINSILDQITVANSDAFFAPPAGYADWQFDIKNLSPEVASATLVHLSDLIGQKFTGNDLNSKTATILNTLDNYKHTSTPEEFESLLGQVGTTKVNEILNTLLTNNAYNWNSSNILGSGLITVTDANKDLAIAKIGQGHFNASLMVSSIIDQLNPQQIIATRDQVINAPYYTTGTNGKFFASSDVFPDPTVAINKLMSVASTGFSTPISEVVKNPNFTEAHALSLLASLNSLPNNNYNKGWGVASSIAAMATALPLTPTLEAAIVNQAMLPSNNYTPYLSNFDLSAESEATLWNYALNLAPNTTSSTNIINALPLNTAKASEILSSNATEQTKRDILGIYLSKNPETAEAQEVIGLASTSVASMMLESYGYSPTSAAVVESLYDKLVAANQPLTAGQYSALFNSASSTLTEDIFNEAMTQPASNLAVLNGAINAQKLTSDNIDVLLDGISNGTLPINWDQASGIPPHFGNGLLSQDQKERYIALAPSNPTIYSAIGNDIGLLATYATQPSPNFENVYFDYTFGYLDYSKPSNLASAISAASGIASNEAKALSIANGFYEAAWDIGPQATQQPTTGLGAITVSMLKANPALGSSANFVNTYKDLISRFGVAYLNLSYEDMLLLKSKGLVD